MKTAFYGKTLAKSNVDHVQKLARLVEKESDTIYIYDKYYSVIKEQIHFNNKIELFHHHEEIKGKVDYLLSIGGDGTLLDSVPLVRDSGIPIMGINVGRLGFLSSVSKDDIDIAVESLKYETFELDTRCLLHLDTRDNLFGDLNFALNELTISRKDSANLIITHVWIDGVLLNSYWADGLIISTPTGSTAYSLSSGGPIIMPSANCFVITPLAAHNLTVRPFVIPDNCEIRIRVEGREDQYLVSLDSRSEIIDSSVELNVKKEGFKVNLIRIPNKHFLNTIREKLQWGLDIRNH
ncbi:MAG: NAD kinase [Hyphomicrobiales bacterium]